MRVLALPTTVLLLLLGSSSLWSQEKSLSGPSYPPKKKDPTIHMVVSPAAAPRPSLQYQLLPRKIDQRPGNAVVWYGKVKSEQTAFFRHRELWLKISELAELPLDQVKDNKLVKMVADARVIFKHIENGARSENCDWQLPIHDEPFFEILLPEIQESRSFARLLAVRARWQIAHGEYHEAVRTLQSGYALSRHLAEGPTLINALVGIAVASLMTRQLQDMAELPDAPNLYWALTSLPRPLIDARPGIEAEMFALHFSLPRLQDLDRPHRDGFWKETLRDMDSMMVDFTGNGAKPDPNRLTLLALQGYPMAKRELIRWGTSRDKVEAMSVSEVVLRYSMRFYEETRDEHFKWLFLPYPNAVKGAEKAEQELRKLAHSGREVLPIASVLLPSIRAVHAALTRSDRDLALARIVQALRMYAAENEGKLPPTLEDLPVPAPHDPVTGKPFQYRMKGRIAFINGPALPGRPIKYEIEMRPLAP